MYQVSNTRMGNNTPFHFPDGMPLRQEHGDGAVKRYGGKGVEKGEHFYDIHMPDGAIIRAVYETGLGEGHFGKKPYPTRIEIYIPGPNDEPHILTEFVNITIPSWNPSPYNPAYQFTSSSGQDLGLGSGSIGMGLANYLRPDLGLGGGGNVQFPANLIPYVLEYKRLMKQLADSAPK